MFREYPESKAEAVRLGSKFFFTGNSCKSGHTDLRYVNGGCVPCAKQRARRGDAVQKANKRERTRLALSQIKRSCKRDNCGKTFTPARRKDQVFCSKRCADLASRYAWRERNSERYRAGENERKKRKYSAEPAHAEKLREKFNSRYHALSQDEKRERSRQARERLEPHEKQRYFREYHRSRSITDINFRIAGALRARVRAAVVSKNGKKVAKTIELIGCTIAELRRHLEDQFSDGMSWNNFGDWHIDHIWPCASFPNLGSSESEQRKCFHYSNLQPLWADENMRKRDRIGPAGSKIPLGDIEGGTCSGAKLNVNRRQPLPTDRRPILQAE